MKTMTTQALTSSIAIKIELMETNWRWADRFSGIGRHEIAARYEAKAATFAAEIGELQRRRDAILRARRINIKARFAAIGR